MKIIEIIDSHNVRFAYETGLSASKKQYSRHSHNCYELYLFIKGEGKYIIEDRLYKLLPFTLILIKPSLAHYINLSKDNAVYERMTLHFEKDTVPPEIFNVLGSGNEVFYLDENNEIIRGFMRLRDAYKLFTASEQSLLLEMYLNEFLIRLKYEQTESVANITNQTVSKILNYIHANIRKPLDIKTLSANLYLSPTYISHTFSKYIKTSVMDYIKEKKIYYAQDLIRSGIKATEAAEMCGFDNYSTFYRLYKSVIKRTPSDELRSDNKISLRYLSFMTDPLDKEQ